MLLPACFSASPICCVGAGEAWIGEAACVSWSQRMSQSWSSSRLRSASAQASGRETLL
jgi:hypothetical protein